MRHTHWNMVNNTQKTQKMRNVNYRTWRIARKLKIMENEKHILQVFKYDKNTEKRGK